MTAKQFYERWKRQAVLAIHAEKMGLVNDWIYFIDPVLESRASLRARPRTIDLAERFGAEIFGQPNDHAFGQLSADVHELYEKEYEHE